MENWDVYDSEPDVLSNRSLFVAIIEEVYPSSTMQLEQYPDSHDTSSPPINTPRSSTDLQEETDSTDQFGDVQALHRREELTTDPFSFAGGVTPPDLTDIDLSDFDDMDFGQQTIQADYDEMMQQPFTSQQQYPQSQIPPAILGGYVEEPCDLNTGHNLVWPNMTMDPMAFTDLPDVPNTQESFVSPPPMASGATMPDQASHYTPGSSIMYPMDVMHSGALAYDPIPTRSPVDTTQRQVILNDAPSRTIANPSGRSGSRQLNRLNATPYPSTSHASIAVRTRRLDHRPSLQPATQQITGDRNLIAVVASSPESMVGSQSREINRGGRKTGLDHQKREEVNQMRKVRGCWVCAIHRDGCDPGQPCGRCLSRSQRGQAHLLPCDRTHLQDLVNSFLSLTINGQYKKEPTISFVNDNVRSWQGGPGIRVYLTCTGLGHFAWDLHEFEPSTPDVMCQRRTVLSSSGRWMAIDKRSPPLALKDVNLAQTEKLDRYVEDIIETHLEQFQEDCFGVEDLDVSLQTDLLKALCGLYLGLPGRATDKNLKGEVRLVLKTLVITYIMDRAITIIDKDQDDVIRRMRSHNDPRKYTRWTSPMLANRQLKHFFSKMREQQYSQTLNRLHQILRTARDKGKHWMASFVLVLGIALVLEQCQHMLWIRAGGRVSRKECTKFDAEFEARAACREIDNKFEFLCNLYHCKYRGRHRQMARFSESSAKVYSAAEAVFVRDITELVDRDGGYLYHRQDLDVSGSEEKTYSSRLVAKFLVNLFGLDRGSP